MAFSGFADEAFTFYEGLLADNSKPYWTSHKEIYERHVRAPLTELCAELEEEFGAVKLFRPYRDVRFSKDKTPYKTHQGGHTGEGFSSRSTRTASWSLRHVRAHPRPAPPLPRGRRFRHLRRRTQAIVDDLRSA